MEMWDINRVHIANFGNDICFFGLTEFPEEDNGPSSITGTVSNSKLTDADSALRLNGQLLFVNPDAPLTMEVVVTGNTFQDSRFAIRLQPVNDGVTNTAERELRLEVDGNTYVGISPSPSENEVLVTFKNRGSKSGTWVRDTMITVDDGDGVFPDEASVNVGPAGRGNSYVLN